VYNLGTFYIYKISGGCEMIKNPRSRFLLHLTIFVTSAFILIPISASAGPVRRIGIVFDGPSELNERALDIYKKEIIAVTEGEFDVQFPTDKTIQADWTAASVRSAIDKLLSDPSVDILITLGIIGSTEVSKRRNLNKPVIAPWVIDRELLGLPISEKGASGIRNLYYLSRPITLSRDIQVFREIVPFNTLALLYMPIVTQLIPDVENVVQRIARERGIAIVTIPVRASIENTLAAIPEDAQAVFVAPLLQYTQDELGQLYDGLIERKLPSFSMLGRNEVQRGALVGLTPAQNLDREARRVALTILSILLGEDPGSLPVEFPIQEELTINMATARAIGFSPKWDIITEADLIQEEPAVFERKLTLEEAVDESVEVNLDLLALDRFVAAGAQDIWLAIAQLLPQADISLDNTYIDKDRAEASLGILPQRSLSGSASVSQLIFDEPSWANVSVQKYLQRARELSLDQIRLDIIAATSIAYLNVLRAKTFEKIRKDNLNLSKSNLEIAKNRRDIGVASPSEVFRWESEISLDRIDVVDAVAQAQNSKILVNRLLNRPQGEDFETVEVGVDDPSLIVSDPRVYPYIDNPGSFRIFIDFMVDEGLNQSPEIKNIDSQIAAQERILKSTKRAFWLPSVSFAGEITNFFADGGAGSDVKIPEDFPIPLQRVDDTQWTILLQATFPLFRGGAKIADYKQARETVSQLQFDRDSTADKVDENIRSALNNAGASFPSIRFARDAAEAARKNLNLVRDSYSRGVVSILDLLDAQNASLTADLNAATAVYDFLIDLMNVQRAAGRFDFFTSEGEREEWLKRLEEFFTAKGIRQPIQ
jgi:outer membrane protein